MVYFMALIFRYNYDVEVLLNNFKYKYLIILNIISISLGLPFSSFFDVILINLFGLNYILFFAPVITIIGTIQVFMLRKINFKFFSNLLFFKDLKKNDLFKSFEKVTFRSSYILIIRTFPILPFFLGSYLIASSQIKKRFIFINSFFGSFFYYLLLFFIIRNV